MHTLHMREDTWLHMQLAERSRQDPGAQHALASDVGLEWRKNPKATLS